MLTCSKVYKDIPFAHRQHNHSGHCSYIHGHNWSIKITFCCDERDENNFVVDFGKLKFLKKWIDENLDHACLINKEDPKLDYFDKNLFKLLIVEDCSCEGLCKLIFEVFSELVKKEIGDRVKINSIEIWEDEKNSAKYEVSNL